MRTIEWIGISIILVIVMASFAVTNASTMTPEPNPKNQIASIDSDSPGIGETISVSGSSTYTYIPGKIQGTKWDDANGNGVRDEGESGVEGVTIWVSGSPTYTYTSTITNESGNYEFQDLMPEYYSIGEYPPIGKVQTFPSNWGTNISRYLYLNDGETIEGIDFGNANASEIHGMKFGDSDGDGVQDPDETGVAWVGMQLFRLISPGEEYYIQYTNTDTNGNYKFTVLAPGFYKVVELPTGSSQTFPANGQPQYVTLGVGEVINGVDFGNQPVPPMIIQGIKFNDGDGNGEQDAGEAGVSGVQICISPLWSCIYTNYDGSYSFLNVPVGSYTVYEMIPSGKTATTPSMLTVTGGSSETMTVNFGNRDLVPPPDDIAVPGSSDWDGDGVPDVGRGNNLNIRKDLTGIGEAASINLTLKWNDGTTRTANMIKRSDSNVWEVTFLPYFPGGSAQMTFKVDILPSGLGPEDIIEIGDIVFRDPSGQIKDACTNEPINEASATLLVEFPPTSGNFIESPSTYQIPTTNPLTTDADGMYSWMTRPGSFKVKAQKSGYETAQSGVVTIPPIVTGLDISLTPVGGCTVDIENPVIASLNVDPDITTPGSNIEIKVSASDNFGVTQVTADGNPLTYSGGFWIGSMTATNSVGSHSISISAKDAANNEATAIAEYAVVYNFSGFFSPVDNLPIWNSVKAGSSIPVKFSLDGYYGLDIFETGYPLSSKISCDLGAPMDIIEETVPAESRSLSYDPITKKYIYVLKTDKAWAGKCRQLSVKLNDGTDHIANFKFLK